MNHLRELGGRELHWSLERFHPAEWELRADDSVVATFRPAVWHYGSEAATGLCADGEWSLHRRGLFRPTYTFSCSDAAATTVEFKCWHDMIYEGPATQTYVFWNSFTGSEFTCAGRDGDPLILLRRKNHSSTSFSMIIGPDMGIGPDTCGLVMLMMLLKHWLDARGS
jgi:hypothetical protein